MKIELTFSKDYCDNWGVYEGVREFMQNGRDAMRSGHSFDADYSVNDKKLKLLTKGATLAHRTLLMGESSKRGDDTMLGHWGEGYKIGSLALVRLGKRVRIRTGEELWEPEIIFSKKFKSEVLAFNITNGKTPRNEVLVEILGIEPVEWDEIKWKFLFLGEHSWDIESTEAGDAILNACGEVFVDGIHVCKVPKLEHGYNFTPNLVKLDRDRRMVEQWKTQSLTAKVWEKLYLDNKLVSSVDSMMANNALDTEHFRYSWCIGEAARKKVADRFIQKHGSDSIAVSSVSEIQELSFYGKKGELVQSESLRTLLQEEIGTVETVRASSATEIRNRFDGSDLAPVEARNLLIATQAVQGAIDSPLPRLHIVEFGEKATLGLRRDNEIYIARHVLSSLEQTLITVVEEVSHDAGGDSSHPYNERVHHIWAKIVMNLLHVDEVAAAV